MHLVYLIFYVIFHCDQIEKKNIWFLKIFLFLHIFLEIRKLSFNNCFRKRFETFVYNRKLVPKSVLPNFSTLPITKIAKYCFFILYFDDFTKFLTIFFGQHCLGYHSTIEGGRRLVHMYFKSMIVLRTS